MLSFYITLAFVLAALGGTIVLLARMLLIHRVVRSAEAASHALQNERKELLMHDPELRRALRVYQVAKVREDLGRDESGRFASAAALVRAYRARVEGGASVRASGVVGWR